MKNQTSKKQPVRHASAKKIIKNDNRSSDTSLARYKFGNDVDLIEERGRKCAVVFPTNIHAQGCLDSDLGLIAMIAIKGIGLGEVNTTDPNEVSYSYSKRHMKEIREIQSAWFKHKTKVDGKEFSEMITFIANYFLPTGPKHNFSGKPMRLGKK